MLFEVLKHHNSSRDIDLSRCLVRVLLLSNFDVAVERVIGIPGTYIYRERESEYSCLLCTLTLQEVQVKRLSPEE